jgi:hypothetical protein
MTITPSTYQAQFLEQGEKGIFISLLQSTTYAVESQQDYTQGLGLLHEEQEK